MTVTIPTLHQMTDHGQEVWLDAYERGRVDGWVAGHDAAMRELGLLVDDDRAGANLKALALMPARADLLERRGQHVAALEYRSMLTDRGLAS